MARIIVAKEKHNVDHLLGHGADRSHYDILIGPGGDIDEDVDVYMEPLCDLSTKATCVSECNSCDKGSDERRIAFKYRKGFFTIEEHDGAYGGLRDAAVLSNNRGLAAGMLEEITDNERRERFTKRQHDILEYFIDRTSTLDGSDPLEQLKQQDNSSNNGLRTSVWLTNKTPDNFKFDELVSELESMDQEDAKERALFVMKNWVSNTVYAAPAYSGIAGWYSRYPRIPYGRATGYTDHHFDKFKLSFPFFKRLNGGFKELLPWRWGNQRAAADKMDPAFLIPETVFTTVTVNKSFRTHYHFDAGDLTSGFSNLLVLSKNENYEGCYLVFPAYRIAVNIRPRDLCLINNHEILHGNTEFIQTEEGGERISVIAYFREDMLGLGSKEYEDYRRLFVDTRRKDETHPLWRPLWNGVFQKMWTSKEWYDFLLEHEKGQQWIDEYHQDLKDEFESTSLDEFF
jgi:hypothetical protein